MNMFAFTRKIYLIQKMFTFTSIQISDYTAFDHTQHQLRSLIFSPDIAYTAKMSNNGQAVLCTRYSKHWHPFSLATIRTTSYCKYDLSCVTKN